MSQTVEITPNEETTTPVEEFSVDDKVITISQQAIDSFRNFLENNKEYLKESAGVFHTDNHSNW